jgi:hypothetical protein
MVPERWTVRNGRRKAKKKNGRHRLSKPNPAEVLASEDKLAVLRG